MPAAFLMNQEAGGDRVTKVNLRFVSAVSRTGVGVPSTTWQAAIRVISPDQPVREKSRVSHRCRGFVELLTKIHHVDPQGT